MAPDTLKDTVWMFSDRYVFEVEVDAENRNVWSLYLAENKLTQPLTHSLQTPSSKHTCYSLALPSPFTSCLCPPAAQQVRPGA